MSDTNILVFAPKVMWETATSGSVKVSVSVWENIAEIHRQDREFFWDRIDSHAQETVRKFLETLFEQREVDFFSEGESYTLDSILRVKHSKTGETSDISVEELILLMEVDPNRAIENYEQYIWYTLRWLWVVVRPHMTEGVKETVLRADKLEVYHPEKVVNSTNDIYTVFLRWDDDTLLADADLGVFTTEKAITLLDLMMFSARNCDLSQVVHCEVCYSDGDVEEMRTIIEGNLFWTLLQQSLERTNPLYANIGIKEGIQSYYKRHIEQKLAK